LFYLFVLIVVFLLCIFVLFKVLPGFVLILPFLPFYYSLGFVSG